MAAVALGGEWGCALVMVYEYSPRGNVGFATSIPQAGYGLAVAVVSLMVSALVGPGSMAGPHQTLTSPSEATWRPLFYLAFPLILLAIYIRVHVPEPEQSTAFRANGETSASPIRDLFMCRKTLLCSVLVLLLEGFLHILFIPWGRINCRRRPGAVLGVV